MTKKPFAQMALKIKTTLKIQELESYLITPVQRIPRYQLLIQQLVKYTPKSHRDYNNLITAWEQIKNICQFINEQERSWGKVKSIQDSIHGQFRAFAGGNRSFVSEGLITVNGEKMMVFLLQDLLIITKPQKKKKFLYKFISRLDINDIDIMQGDQKGKTPESKFVVKNDNAETYLFEFPDPKQKQTWWDLLRNCVAKGRRRSTKFTVSPS
eukprot:TRINITY_DN5162_c0_g1_i1.p1 TRINITY_DN5162_c0_g1~~TRINITY_DN5162_c0_g1_i1.p1  ORF type:complete len:211 (+),score=58.68 TRINITY_DN5162_c0_g1_i1:54-686(+)